MKKTLVIISLIALALFLTGCNEAEITDQTSQKNILQENPIPGQFYLSKENGWLNTKLPKQEYYLVYTSASWCPPCKILSPIIEEATKGPNKTVILIAGDDTEKATLKYMKGKNFFVINKGSHSNRPQWAQIIWDGVQTYPNLAIINSKGEILKQSPPASDPIPILQEFISLEP